MPIKKITKSKEPTSPLVKTCACCGFWVKNGAVLCSLIDLRNELQTMSAEAFAYHVTAEKNDFIEWIDKTLQEPSLAKTLEKAKTQQTFLKKIDEYIKSQK